MLCPFHLVYTTNVLIGESRVGPFILVYAEVALDPHQTSFNVKWAFHLAAVVAGWSIAPGRLAWWRQEKQVSLRSNHILLVRA